MVSHKGVDLYVKNHKGVDLYIRNHKGVDLYIRAGDHLLLTQINGISHLNNDLCTTQSPCISCKNFSTAMFLTSQASPAIQRRSFILLWGTSRWLQASRFSQSIGIQMRGVLRYKREEYWSVSLSWELSGTESTAIQIGGVLQYKLEAYCSTFLRSSGG